MTWFKRIIVLFTWALVLLGGIFALLSSQSLRESRPIVGYTLTIQSPENQHFLIKEDLNDVLREAGAPWDSVSRKEINIPMLEENLRKHPLVLGAEVFSTWEGVLHVEIVQKEAKARMVNGLDMMYVDNMGGTFPLSAHATARLPLLTGLEDSLQRVEALQLLQRATEHAAFPGGWSAIDRDDRGRYTAYPDWHPHAIRWGAASRFDEKAHKAHALYAQLLQAKSLDSLRWMDVRFAGQVVYEFID